MRADALGMWWRDEPVVKTTKAPPPKRTPPEPVWLRPDYLPGLDEALRFNVPLMDDEELAKARLRGDLMLFDVEVYWNYFLVSFASFTTGAVVYFEMAPGYELSEYQLQKIEWIMRNFTIVGFNSYHYDMPMLALALAGKSCADLKTATNRIIVEEYRPSDVLKLFKTKALKNINHIDLIEVAPLSSSLKIYGGRLHVPRMQDLPFHPETLLSPQQMAIVRWYNINDLTQTGFLLTALKEQIELREMFGGEFNIDLRSKSDAQMAEAVIEQELWRLSGTRPGRRTIDPGTRYRYNVPNFLKYESPVMNWALDVIRNAAFVVEFHGSIGTPPEIDALRLRIADNVYRMGIGGLHSTESKAAYVAGAEYVIIDRDVASYYPQIILNQDLYPEHLGPHFIKVYGGIVTRRLAAKAAGQKAVAESLKIVVNGSYGKFGSKYSILYAPEKLMQVTMTGQLALLMLIERLELQSINVISANTDGVVIKCPVERRVQLETIVKQWEQDTSFQTEETQYSAYYARDVNNYIAVKVPDKKGKVGIKAKGAYSNPWNNPENDGKVAITRLHKNPTTTVCLDAVEALLTKNVALTDTIRACTDIRKFICVRKVKGGAVKKGEYLGASIRWYYALNQEGEMVSAATGNKVPRSDGAKPLMQLPEVLPEDIDYDWYLQEARKILKEIAYLTEV